MISKESTLSHLGLHLRLFRLTVAASSDFAQWFSGFGRGYLLLIHLHAAANVLIQRLQTLHFRIPFALEIEVILLFYTRRLSVY